MEDSRGIIVLGPYRSGTSATAQVLHKFGVDFGPKRYLIPAHDWNPGGFFERQDINDANDALIRSIGRNLADPGDPRELAEKGNRRSFDLADLSWQKCRGFWGIKDPRLCATLLAWLDAGVLDRRQLKIVHVRRGLAAAVKSAMLCPPVRSFCDGTEGGAERMLARYAELAEWHVQTLGLPTLSFDYERLIQEPQSVVEQMAEFVGESSRSRVRQGVRMIGKDKGRWSLAWQRFFIRGPRRVFRFLIGQGPLLRGEARYGLNHARRSVFAQPYRPSGTRKRRKNHGSMKTIGLAGPIDGPTRIRSCRPAHRF